MRLTKILLVILVASLLLSVTVFAFEIYEIPHTVDIPDGAYGVLQIPSIGTDSPLYEGRAFQDIIDDEDSALIHKYKRGWYIGDHAGSEVGGGYWYVEDIRVGASAFITTDNGTKSYLCTSIYFAHQNGWNYAYHGQNINPTASGFICVSCSDYSEDWVYVAVFEYVGEMP